MARKRFEWKVRDQIISLGERTLIVGVLNVTPDSFSDGGEYLDPDRAFAHAIELEDAGADILEIGAESTRPGSTRISEAEELRRLVPVLKRLRGKINIPIAVDTYKAAVAAKALELGASIINDPSALTFDPELARAAVNADAGLILNHMRGTPDTWAKLPPMKNPVPVIVEELSAAVHRAVLVGFDRKRIVVDPGLGFGKRKEQNAEILAQLGGLTRMDLPVMVGPSRKHFLSHIVGQDAPESTEFATAAAVTAAIMNGAHIVRVHDVKAMKAVVEVADEILRGAYVAEPAEEPAKRPAGKQDSPRESSREGGGYRAGFAARAPRQDPSEQTGRKATGAAAIPVPPIGKRISRNTDAVVVDLSAAKATADEDIRKTKIVAAEEVDDDLDIDDPIELKPSADDDDMEIVLLDDDEDEEDTDDEDEDDDIEDDDEDVHEDDDDEDEEDVDDEDDQDDDLEIPLDDSDDELDVLEPSKKIAAKKAERNQPIARDPRTKTGSGPMDREGATRGAYKPAAGGDRKPDNRKSSFGPSRGTGSRPERSDDSRGGFPKRTGFAPVRRPDSRPAAGSRPDSRGPSSDRPDRRPDGRFAGKPEGGRPSFEKRAGAGSFEKRSGPPSRFGGEREFDGPRSGPPRSGAPRSGPPRDAPPRGDRPSRDGDRPRFGAGAGDRGDRPARGPAGFGSKPFGAKPFNKRPNDDGDSRSEGGSDRPPRPGEFEKPGGFKKFGGFKKPFTGRPSSDSDRPRTGRPSAGKPSFGRPPSDRPAGRPSFGKPGTGRPPSGRPPSDRPPSGRPSSGRPSSGRPPSGKPPFRGGKPTSSGSGGKSGSPSGRRGPSGPGRRS